MRKMSASRVGDSRGKLSFCPSPMSSAGLTGHQRPGGQPSTHTPQVGNS